MSIEQVKALVSELVASGVLYESVSTVRLYTLSRPLGINT